MKKYHYTESGLDNIYLTNGYKITKNSDGEEEIFIQNIHGLHKAIGMNLIFKPGLLSGQEIKFIRHTLDFSQKTLAHYLGVDYQSVLGWEKNKWQISATADHFLKTIFFAFLNKKNPIYDLVIKIAELSEQKINSKNQHAIMKMRNQQWQADKAA